MANGWYVKRNEQKYGPYSSTQLVEMAKKGQVLPLDWVVQGESGKWMLASQVKGLFAAPAAAVPATSAAPPPLPTAVVATPSPAFVRTQASGKLLGFIPTRIAPPIFGMFAVVLLSLLASFFCGSALVFIFSFLHNVGAVACIVLTTRLQKSLYPLLAGLLTMTVWGWYCFTAVWIVVSVLGLLAGIAVGIWAMFAFFAPEKRRQFADPSLPARLARWPFPALAGILGGGSLTLILGIGMVLWLSQGSKTGGGSSGNDGGKESVKSGKDAGNVKVDLPDFSKVDYSIDFSKVDYTKGPQGQKLETRTEDGGGRSWQQYQGPDGKPLFHAALCAIDSHFALHERAIQVTKRWTFRGPARLSCSHVE